MRRLVFIAVLILLMAGNALAAATITIAGGTGSATLGGSGTVMIE